ncbi:MAG: hypothetical protein JOS17DRAFT_780491 [Linnemannia elongata]|nr:MAG: hypothetical protein JOS17DRAFT_780491 [Linnemannia elongata]
MTTELVMTRTLVLVDTILEGSIYPGVKTWGGATQVTQQTALGHLRIRPDWIVRQWGSTCLTLVSFWLPVLLVERILIFLVSAFMSLVTLRSCLLSFIIHSFSSIPPTHPLPSSLLLSLINCTKNLSLEKLQLMIKDCSWFTLTGEVAATGSTVMLFFKIGTAVL